MNKYQIHYNYNNKFLYSNLSYTKFLNKFKISKNHNDLSLEISKNKNFKNLKNLKNFYNKNFLSKNDKNRDEILKSSKIVNELNPNYSHNYLNNITSNFNNININSNNINKINKKSTNSNSNNDEINNLNFSKFNKNLEIKYLNNFSNYKNLKSRNCDKYISKIFSTDINENNYNYLIYSFLATKEEENNNNIDVNIEEIPKWYRDLSEVFSKKNADKLPPHRLTDCKIVLEKDASLHYGPIYQLTQEESEVLKEYIKENLEKGFIRPSESPAGYPVLFQKKKDGSLRLCVDYKKLNDVTIRNSYPIPMISDIIEKVKDSNYFTKLDLRSAYNLIRIREGDEYKTAFRTKYGHYEYLVMPFGLKNAPATFQSFINSVLRPFLEDFVIIYLDDILIYSKNIEEHHNHVRKVLQKLLENNLYAKLEKCEFDKNEVEFLGYILSGKGVSTDPKKIKSIEEWPRPESVKDVQRFVGLCNYYRRFVNNFAMIAKPLHNLTKKNNKFIWTEQCENAFVELKKRLTSTPILLHPDPQKAFIVECDASNYAIGAILSQKDDKGKLHPVAYYSRSLNNAEINYSITDKELLAIKCAFSTWRHLLLGAKYKVTVYTDHRNLLYTLGGKIGNQRQHRWHLFFQEYNFQLIYRQGRKNGKPDSLSRRPDYMNKNENEVKPEYILDNNNVKEIPSFVGIMSDFINKIIENLNDDNTAKDINLYFSETNRNNNYNYKPFRKMNKFKIENNLILYNNLIYIPENLRLEILERYHENPAAGHLGIRKTEELITRNYWWPKLHEDVVSYIKSCEICTRNKINTHKKYGLLQPLNTPDRPWKSIEIDFLCGLPPSKGYTVLMVVVDRFSKMIHLIPFKKIPDAKETADAFLKNIFKLHGLPSDIYSDRGSQFTSALWKEFLEKLRITPNIATTDHHETVGQVERCNAFIEQYLRCYSRSFFHDDWVEWIHLAEFVYNNSINDSTKQSPFYTNYGFYPPMDDIYLFDHVSTNNQYLKDINKNFVLVKDVLMRSKDLYKRAADKHRMPAPVLKVGDKVWIHAPPSFITSEPSKLSPCKYGPYKITYVYENNNYEIDISKSPFPKHHPVFHISELEPFVPTPTKFSDRNKYRESIKDIVEITNVRANRKEGYYEYRIRYKYKTSYNWIPAYVIEDDPRYQQLLIDFNKSIRKNHSTFSY